MSAQVPPRRSTAITAAVVVILIVSVYSAYEISSLQAEVSSLQNQVLNDQQNFQSLQNSLYNLETRLSAATTTTSPPEAIGINAACLSITPICPGTYSKYPPYQANSGYVYWIELVNQGSEPLLVNSSVFIGIKDASRLTFVGFNTTLSQAIAPYGSFNLNGTTWPIGSGGSSKLSPGDVVAIGVTIGGAQATAGGKVYSCSVSTTMINNSTNTVTATQTACS